MKRFFSILFLCFIVFNSWGQWAYSEEKSFRGNHNITWGITLRKDAYVPRMSYRLCGDDRENIYLQVWISNEFLIDSQKGCEITNPGKMLLRLKNGEILTLESRSGKNQVKTRTVAAKSESRVSSQEGGLFSGYDQKITTNTVYTPEHDEYTQKTAYYEFPLDHADIQDISEGVKKIRVSVLPENFEKEWKGDKFGKNIAKMYKDVMKKISNGDFKEEKDNSFEAGF